MVPTDARTVARFEAYAGPELPSGCRLWQGPTKPNGYGYLEINGRNVYAHRIAFAVAHGQPAHGVLHRCDTPACVAAACLFDGTQVDNMQDAKAKGRLVDPPVRRGAAHALATLSDAEVAELRAASGTQRELARRFSVAPATVWRIRRGLTRCLA